jgi:hypothetical protein
MKSIILKRGLFQFWRNELRTLSYRTHIDNIFVQRDAHTEAGLLNVHHLTAFVLPALTPATPSGHAISYIPAMFLHAF